MGGTTKNQGKGLTFDARNPLRIFAKNNEDFSATKTVPHSRNLLRINII